MTMMTDELIGAARHVAAESGVGAAVLLALAIVETNGVAYAAFDGRREPLIRFEGHYFDRLLSPENRRRARALKLSDPAAGRVRNPAAQSARWRLLDRAAAIDPAAAYAATSWGLGQVMGSHWQALGFDGPEALATEARRSAEGQLALVARFLKAEQLDLLLGRQAFAAFARRYNGPGYARNRYDAKIESAYAAATARLAETLSYLVPGARGERIAGLQRDLARHGLAVVADGIFGPRTAAAVSAFRASKGLSDKALADTRTLALLSAEADQTGGTVSKGWLTQPAMLSRA